MPTSAKALLRAGLLRAVSVATRRHPVLLPVEASDDASILALEAPYRIEGDQLTIDLREPTRGTVSATLIAYEGHSPTRVLWRSTFAPYAEVVSFRFDLRSGAVWLGNREWGRAPVPPARRFCWQFELATPAGRKRRLTGHYRAEHGREVDRGYYHGDDYVDYEAQSAGEHAAVIALMRDVGASGPVLEIGCATGGLLAALQAAGVDGIGVEKSRWAAEEAASRLGAGAVVHGDIEVDPVPPQVAVRAPYSALVLWAVLEHFRDPFAVVRRLTGLMRPGSVLLINTTNADSLSHQIFGAKWEGYFDWTHHGVDRVRASTIAERLAAVGWDVLRLTTDRFWTVDADPTAASLREWWTVDARFRRLLVERNLGDCLICVAVRR